jgi:hypothetical protein
MLIVWPLTVIEYRVLRSEVGLVRIQPSINVIELDWNDAAIMTRSGDFGWRLVGDGRKREQVRRVRVPLRNWGQSALPLTKKSKPARESAT